jgi:hypothetical protein
VSDRSSLLVPSLDASGTSGRHGGPTERGGACLREAIFLTAEQARRTDPTLAARYHRLMVEAGKHYNSALCNITSTLLTRIVACWRAGEPYVIRDLDGNAVDIAQGRRIVLGALGNPDRGPCSTSKGWKATSEERDRRSEGSHGARRPARPRSTLGP